MMNRYFVTFINGEGRFMESDIDLIDLWSNNTDSSQLITSGNFATRLDMIVSIEEDD
jgi:hypothetical protein